MDFNELKTGVGSGLLSFPVTDFDENDAFDARAYGDRVAWMSSYPVTALFAAGGTGEMFSLGWAEYAAVIRAAVAARARHIPVIAGVGYGTAMATEMARTAQSAGAHGLLLMPHYLIESTPAGQAEHVRRVCEAVDIGVIYYARGGARLGPAELARLADDCPNLIGYKDGFGDVQELSRIVARLGDRLTYVGGMPTAEVFATTYASLGITTYSSAAFNFVPDYALEFYAATRRDDRQAVADMLERFFLPLVELRDRRRGYAVSMIKRGAALIGRPAGHVRPPLTELEASEVELLQALIARTLDSAAVAA